MRILVTGGCGYIGSVLLQSLKETDSDIVVFDDLEYHQGPMVSRIFLDNKIKFFNENVLNWTSNLEEEVTNADVIIPLAAVVGAPRCDRYTGLAKALNYEWYEKLVKRLSPNQLVIYPNTNSGYGSVPDGICTEETPSNPISLYGKTKQQTEDLLLLKHKNTIAFRLATVFGLSPRPRLDLLVNSMTYEATRFGKIKVFDGHFRRNYVSVNDVSKAFDFAINNSSKMVGNVYNLGNDNINMTKMELAKTISSIVKSEVVEVKSPGDQDKRDYLVSSQKLKDAGFIASTSLEEEIPAMSMFVKFINTYNDKYLRNY